MYNEDHKNAYLDTFKESPGKKNIESFFKCVSETETELDKDVAEFSKSELIEYYSRPEFCNPSYVVEQLKFLRKYRIWYNENVDHCEISLVSSRLADEIDFTESIKQNMFFSLDALLDILEDQNNIYDLTDICSYVLGWYQIKLNDTVKLKKEDFQFEEGVAIIRLTNRTIRVEHARAADLLKTYHQASAIKREFLASEAFYEEDNNIYFLRPFRKKPSNKIAPMSAATSRQKCKDRAKAYGTTDIDYRNVMLSGELCEVSKLVANGADAEEVIKKMHPRFAPGKIKDRYQLFVQFENSKNQN